jgi:hypothetical protein
MVLLLLFLLVLTNTASAVEVQVSPVDRPGGAVILVIDGLGSAYVYPEHPAYTLEGTHLPRTVLYNLTGEGARVLDVRAPVPATAQGHSVLVTGFSGAGEESVGEAGSTIFDAARAEGYLCLAVLQRGDFPNMLQEQDAALFLPNNSLEEVPSLQTRPGIDPEIRSLLEAWRPRLTEYVSKGGYQGYNRWAVDAAKDLVGNMDQPFLLLVNVGGTDSVGHYQGPKRYLEAVSDLDRSLGYLSMVCMKKGLLLVVTAYHGMAFSKGTGGHASGKYAERLESRRIPLVFRGPGVDELNLAGRWSQADIAPTVLRLMGLASNLSLADGRIMPILKSYSLEVLGGSGEVTLTQEGTKPAVASGERVVFRGLERGIYAVDDEKGSREVCINGDEILDLRSQNTASSQTWDPWPDRWVIGVVMILAVNLVGIAAILRIIRKE